MLKDTNEQYPIYLPLYYRIFCKIRKVIRQTNVRINESRARKNGPQDIVSDGVFIPMVDSFKVKQNDINKSAFWINEDLAFPGVKNIADKIEAVKNLIWLKGLRYTSSAGMFARNTYTPESEKRKLWENAWIICHSGVKPQDKVLDIGGASTAFILFG